jgi:hypothetical protein
VQPPVADVVLAAVKKIAGRGGGYVTLAQIQADAGVQARVMVSSRVVDIMAVLEGRGVRMTARHPQPTWLVEEEN